MAQLRNLILTVLTIALAAMSFTRSEVYSDSRSLWSDIILKSPFKARPHHKLGLAFQAAGKIEPAVRQFEIALALKPDYAHALVNLAVAYHRMGQNDQAFELLDRSLKIDPFLLVARKNLGLWLLDEGSIDLALNEFHKIVQIHPRSPEAGFALRMIEYINEMKAEARFRNADPKNLMPNR